MSITQKKIKDEINQAEVMIHDTVTQSQNLLEEIRVQRDESTSIDTNNDQELNENIDIYNGLKSTIQYYTGHLNALEWVLKEMRAKNKKRSSKK